MIQARGPRFFLFLFLAVLLFGGFGSTVQAQSKSAQTRLQLR